jgi:hypothetical protein
MLSTLCFSPLNNNEQKKNNIKRKQNIEVEEKHFLVYKKKIKKIAV